ncbi:ABC transporter B family member 9 [Solanum lycopersicum]|uniref:ABC transporter B family member 9 n=1 Tax=Solanum lycopersicum TaxID=4081 RepID=UPI000276760F|nr:ABC transporter B family member 9-like [Solanum lycopersicum]
MARGGDEKIPFYKLFAFADRNDIILMLFGILGAIASGVSKPLMSLMFGDLIDSYGTSDQSNILDKVSRISLKFVYLGIGTGIASLLQVACWSITGERQVTRIKCLYLKTILRQDIEFFDTQSATGEVIERMSGDTILLQEAMGEKVGNFVMHMSTFIGGFVVAFIKEWQLTLVLLATIPAIAISFFCAALVLSKMSGSGQAAYANAGKVVEQTVGGIRTVVSFTGENLSIVDYNSKLENAYKPTVNQALASGIGLGTILMFSLFSYGLAIWYGAKLIIDKNYSGGDIVTVIFSAMLGGSSIGQASPSLSAFSAGQAAAYKIYETIKRTPKIDPYDPRGIQLEDIKGEIELKDVYFKYPARPDVQIFSGFSLYIPSGKTAALVGQSGSGKSTVISLLQRFYDPEAGEILIDGVDIKKFQLKWLRQQMGLVSQEPVLFATTIRENIMYGKENSSEEEIRNAIKLANAAKFIDKLPKGLDTMVGGHGTQISGGQKQRIAIARAILKDPRILLLDEATSALDVESERIIQDALSNIMINRTTVVVAHRLTTIRNADLIAVVNLGKLVEQGTHDELIKDIDGAYSQLVQMQQNNKHVENTKGKEIEDSNAQKRLSCSKNPSGRSQKFSISSWKSASKGSSSRYSLAYDLGVTAAIDFHESIRRDDGAESSEYIVDSNRNLSTQKLMSLAYLNKPEVPIMLVGTIAASINGAVYPVFGLLLSTSIKIFYESHHELRKDSRFWALMFVVIGVVVMIVAPLQNYAFGIAGAKLIQRIRSMTFAKLVYQEISWFDDPANSCGAIGARLSSDASTIRNLAGDALATIVQNISTVATGMVIALIANWILALIMLAILPLLVLQGIIQIKLLQESNAEAKVANEEASQVANDAIGSIRTVASFCAEEKVMEMYQRKSEAPLKQGAKTGLVGGVGLGFSSFVLFSLYALTFYLGAILVKHDKAKFSEVFKVFFALSMASIGLIALGNLPSDLSKSKGAAASIFEILDSKPRIDSSSSEGIMLDVIEGNIELQHISFKYPTRPDMQIFKDLSLSIPAGKTVALVGESGSGKSTVISLIERFYDPDQGYIYLDGVELKKLNLRWLRQQMGLVGQEPILFNETISSNIAYGRQGEVTEEEIISVAKASNAHNFISSLPNGYKTTVGERGVQLSGGQKQRIAIARAILKDPKILLLDEATSALDTESERIVQEALDRVMVNRTTVVVAHRLTTIKNADVIAVVKNGVVAEKGTHDVLMNNTQGVYASLVALQTGAT